MDIESIADLKPDNKMKIIKTIEDLVPDQHNPNKGTERGRALLEDSLREDGAGRSILVDKKGSVIAGNKTLEVADELGLPIRVVQTDGNELVVVQRTDVEAESVHGRRMSLRDNRTSEVGLDWDVEVLADLHEIMDLSNLWSDNELAELIPGNWPGVEDPGPLLREAAKLQEKWDTAQGQIWKIGDHRLAVGDCTDWAVVDAVMGGEKARVCLTDPPYNYDIGYDVVDDILSLEEYEAFTRRWWSLARRYAACVLVTPGLKNLDFYYRNFDITWTCAWVKKNAMTASAIGSLSVWEPILYQADEWDWEPIIVAGKPRKRVKRDVYEFPIRIQEGVGKHPCPKLLEFWERLLLDFSSPGDVVLDMFVGAGTSLVACERRKRICRAIELSSEYCAVTLERMVGMGLEPKLVENGK